MGRELTRIEKWRHVVGAAALLILLMYAHGSLSGVPFPTSVSFFEAIRLTWTPSNLAGSTSDVEVQREAPFLIAALPVAIVWIAWRPPSLRIALAAVALVMPPLMFLTGFGRIAVFLVAPFFAPFVTFAMLFQDMRGEDYDLVPMAAVGWWIVLWIAAMIVEIRYTMKHRSRDPRGFEAIVKP